MNFRWSQGEATLQKHRETLSEKDIEDLINETVKLKEIQESGSWGLFGQVAPQEPCHVGMEGVSAQLVLGCWTLRGSLEIHGSKIRRTCGTQPTEAGIRDHFLPFVFAPPRINIPTVYEEVSIVIAIQKTVLVRVYCSGLVAHGGPWWPMVVHGGPWWPGDPGHPWSHEDRAWPGAVRHPQGTYLIAFSAEMLDFLSWLGPGWCKNFWSTLVISSIVCSVRSSLGCKPSVYDHKVFWGIRMAFGFFPFVMMYPTSPLWDLMAPLSWFPHWVLCGIFLNIFNFLSPK